MTAKPTPPTWAELEHDEQVARAARVLGVTVPPQVSQSERVFRAAVAAARKTGAPVRSVDIRREDATLPIGTIASATVSLIAAGRFLKIGAGLFLPVLDEAKG